LRASLLPWWRTPLAAKFRSAHSQSPTASNVDLLGRQGKEELEPGARQGRRLHLRRRHCRHRSATKQAGGRPSDANSGASSNIKRIAESEGASLQDCVSSRFSERPTRFARWWRKEQSQLGRAPYPAREPMGEAQRMLRQRYRLARQSLSDAPVKK